MNDAAEQLQVAIEECGRLEREVAELKRYEALANKHWHRDQDDLAFIVAERDKAIAERDASRQVNAEFLAARSGRIVDDHEVCTTELAAAYAVIEAVRAVMDKPSKPNDFYISGFQNQYDALSELYGEELPKALHAALGNSPARAAANRAVAQ